MLVAEDVWIANYDLLILRTIKKLVGLDSLLLYELFRIQ